MPRNSSGVMALPAGNPVIPGTLIESTWANPTMADLANEITLSLPRNGAAGMTGPLILARDGILPKEAVTVSQIESAITGSNSYLPAGAIQAFAFVAIPTGWLECNGAEVSRTTYANLFAYIGITFGAGNGTTTFNLPDLRGMFVRGFDNGRSLDPGRLFGSIQQDSNRAHGHAVSDPGHNHAQAAHSHTVGDPGHSHTIPLSTAGQPYDSGGGPVPARYGAGISSAVSATGISLGAAQPAISPSGTGIGISSEGTEGRPKNVAMVYCIKAFGALQTDGLGAMAFQNKDTVDITGGSGTFTVLRCTSAPVLPTDVARLADIGGSIAQIYSSDTDLMVVDNTTPSEPILRLQSNVPNGMAKLGPGGQIPPELINLTGLDYAGPWDASTGLNPSQALPLVVWNDGDFFEIEVAGTLTLINSSGVAGPILVGVGDSIVWMDGSPAYVTAGWYYQPFPVASSLPASSIAFSPTPEVSATDVQAAIEEVANVVGNGPAFSAYQTIAQAVPSSSAALVTFDTEEFDTNNNFASSRFTPTVAGYYSVLWGVQQLSNNTTLLTELKKTGVTYKFGTYVSPTNNPVSLGSALVLLNGTTDYIEVHASSPIAGNTAPAIASVFFQGFLARAA